MFENIRQNVARPVDEMLNSLEVRVQAGKFEEKPLNKALEVAARGLLGFKNKNIDVGEMSVQDIADMSNAWKAWERGGVFAGEEDKALRVELQNLLQDKPEYKFARQVWRTEVVSYLMEKLVLSNRTDKAEIMEKIMASQIVQGIDSAPFKVLTGAMYLDDAIRDKSARLSLAEKMKNSSVTGKLADIKTLFGENYRVEELKVVTGGAFLNIPLDLGAGFVFEKMILEGDRIYAQMKNGCKGNLVIMKVKLEVEPEEEETPPPEEEDPEEEGTIPKQPEKEDQEAERAPNKIEIINALLNFKHAKYSALERSYFASKGFVRKMTGLPAKITDMDVEPAAKIKDASDNEVSGKLLYISKSGDPKNAPFYLIINESSIGAQKIIVRKGNIQYSSRYLGIIQSADYQPPDKKYEIDFTSDTTLDASLKAMFDDF